MSRGRHHDQSRSAPASGLSRLGRTPDLGDLGADFPVSDELRTGLLEIAVSASPDRDGEARTAELEPIAWPELEPSAALIQRLLAIPERRPVRRRAALGALPGPGITIAASYLLAVALTLAIGDPVAIGRKATSQLSAAAGEHLLEPAAQAGASMQAGFGRRLGALQGRWHPAGLIDEPLHLPTDKVRAWFRNAVASSSDAFGNLTDLFSRPDPETGDEPPATTRTRRGPNQERTSA